MSTDDVVRKLNLLFAEICSWCNSNKLTLHTGKSKVMILQRNIFVGPLFPVQEDAYLYPQKKNHLDVRRWLNGRNLNSASGTNLWSKFWKTWLQFWSRMSSWCPAIQEKGNTGYSQWLFPKNKVAALNSNARSFVKPTIESTIKKMWLLLKFKEWSLEWMALFRKWTSWNHTARK